MTRSSRLAISQLDIAWGGPRGQDPGRTSLPLATGEVHPWGQVLPSWVSTTRDAAAAGVPAVELRKLAGRGALERRGHGVYRMPDLPIDDRGQFAEAVRLVGPRAYLIGDAVVAFHGLALVNPRRIRVGSPHRVRATLPQWVQVVVRNLPERSITEYDGIRSTTVAQALLDCQGTVMGSRLADAVRDARREGLITNREARLLRYRLRGPEHRRTTSAA